MIVVLAPPSTCVRVASTATAVAVPDVDGGVGLSTICDIMKRLYKMKCH